MGSFFFLLAAIFFVVQFVFLAAFFSSRYKRCPSDMILVIYGKVGEGKSSRCIHGGGAMVWPFIQDYAFMSLTPMTISIPLPGALCSPNSSNKVTNTFTVAIGTPAPIMNNAAKRLLNLAPRQIEELAREIIVGYLQQWAASTQGQSLPPPAEMNVELNKVGLELIASVRGQ